MSSTAQQPVSQFKLLAKRRFLPLFLTQFFGAFNDNVFKNALVVLITYRIATQTGMSSGVLVTLATGLFVLPFLLFSALAGQIADKYEKSKLIRIIKVAEIVLMIIAIIAFAIPNMFISLFLSLLVLFLLGAQSTFFGPLKYAILPVQLHKEELIGGNALVEAATFLAILLGSILGSVVVLSQYGVLLISALILLFALIGWISSLYIPLADTAAPDLPIRYNIITQTWEILKFSTRSTSIFLSILGISWFWFIGVTFMAQLPVYTKDVIGAQQTIFTLFLTVFSVGIALGSMLCNRLLKGQINTKYVPLAAFGMTIFIIDLFFTSQKIPVHDGADLMNAMQFLTTAYGWRILLDLSLISVCGGLYTVPLYALLQIRSEESHRARTIASNNVMNALFMVLATLFALLMFALHFSVTQVFLAVAIANAIVAICIYKSLPRAANVVYNPPCK